MGKSKGFCQCGTEIEVNICCSGHMCGCMGLPTEPPFCSGECYDKFIESKEEKKKENDCLNCKHFESYYDMYDQDPLEPHDVGRCKKNEIGNSCSEGFICEDHSPIDKKKENE